MASVFPLCASTVGESKSKNASKNASNRFLKETTSKREHTTNLKKCTGKGENAMERKHTKRAAVTDEEVEAEIAELKQDEYVKLAQRYDQYRARRRTYLYQLRIKQRKGIELAARGVTLENLEEMGDEP